MLRWKHLPLFGLACCAIEMMAAVASLSVPLVAEVGMGDSWGAAH